jgi:hypothetical protein
MRTANETNKHTAQLNTEQLYVQKLLLFATEVGGETECLTFRGVRYVVAQVHHITHTVNKITSRIAVTEIFFVLTFVTVCN